VKNDGDTEAGAEEREAKGLSFRKSKFSENREYANQMGEEGGGDK